MRKNIGCRVQLHPPAIFLDSSGTQQPSPDDDWIVANVGDAIATLNNVRTGHSCEIGLDHIHNFSSNPNRDWNGLRHGFLTLRMQLFVCGDNITLKPNLRPGEPVSAGSNVLICEALLEANLDCHSWKVAWMVLDEDNLPTCGRGVYQDIWDLMGSLWIPPYSKQAYARYQVLFDVHILDLRKRFDRLLQVYGHVLPHDIQTQISAAGRQLETEALAYRALQTLTTAASGIQVDPNAMFTGRFRGVIATLRGLSRALDARRKVLLQLQ